MLPRLLATCMQAHVPACLLLLACRRRLSGLQQLFGLSDGDVVALFRCLVQLLELQPEEGVRPRRDKLEALLGVWEGLWAGGIVRQAGRAIGMLVLFCCAHGMPKSQLLSARTHVCTCGSCCCFLH